VRRGRHSWLHWLGALALLAQGALAAPRAAEESLRAELLFEPESGVILHESDAGAARYPASLTKLMTAYLTFEALGGGFIKEDDLITVSAHVAAQPTSRLGLRRGEKITVADALRATLVSSANDAAVALAEHLGQTEAAFAELMTGTAERLGMHHTVFRNASGLPNDSQVTSAFDMAKLARAVIAEYPEYYARFSTAEYTWKGKPRRSTNALMRDYPGADGIKTGYTCGSGFNLIASAVREGRRLVGIVMGARSKEERNGRMRELLDLGFKTGLAELESPTTLDSLNPGAPGRPPMVLSGKACGSGAGCSRTPLTTTELPGWAVLLGSFRGKPYAEQALAKACRNSEEDLRGTPALVERARPEYSLWTALLVGYTQSEARQACKSLGKRDQVCRVLAPQGIKKTLGKPPPSKSKSAKAKARSKAKVQSAEDAAEPGPARKPKPRTPTS
jgi:D-alanyl-D-alanine carboxypeptidase